jgi:hypothetical protein
MRSTNKPECMIFNAKNRSEIFITSFLNFKLLSSLLQLVSRFNYLGHVISSDSSYNSDVSASLEICL